MLLYLTTTCRHIHAEPDLLIFQINDLRINAKSSPKSVIETVSPRQLRAIRTHVWPRQCDQILNNMILMLTGLQRIVVVVRENGWSGDDFYVLDDNATQRVHLWYKHEHRAAIKRIYEWRAKGIELSTVSSADALELRILVGILRF